PSAITFFHRSPARVSRIWVAVHGRFLGSIRGRVFPSTFGFDDAEGLLVGTKASSTDVAFAPQNSSVRAYDESGFRRIDPKAPHHAARFNSGDLRERQRGPFAPCPRTVSDS